MKNIFIVNKASKSGKAAEAWEETERFLNGIGTMYEVHFTEKSGDATKFAREATSNNEETALFVMGGDGTLNEVLNGIEDFDNTYYTPLPAGSGNDFVNGIALKGDALEILKRAISQDTISKLDIGKVTCDGNSRLFGVSSGIGVDAYVCLQALNSPLKKFLNRLGLGKATYGLLTVGDIFSMPFSDADIMYTFGGAEKNFKLKSTIFAAAMNCPAEGGGIPMAPGAHAASGHLTAFIAHDISRLRCFALLPSLVAGKHEGKKGFDLINFDKMEISMKDEMCVHADGEHVGFYKHVTFECLPGKLKVRGV